MFERSQRLVLAFDCDDVLLPTSHQLLDAYNDRYGTTVPYEDFYCDDLWQAATAAEAAQRVDVLIKEGVMADAVPDEETIKSIEAMARVGHEMHIVTGRQSYQESETRMHIARYYPKIFRSVEYTNMYASGHNLHLRRSKGEVCHKLGAHMLIDDHIVHGNAVLAAGVERAAVYGDYPWNQFDVLEPGMVHCRTMGEVALVVQQLAISQTKE